MRSFPPLSAPEVPQRSLGEESRAGDKGISRGAGLTPSSFLFTIFHLPSSPHFTTSPHSVPNSYQDQGHRDTRISPVLATVVRRHRHCSIA